MPTINPATLLLLTASSPGPTVDAATLLLLVGEAESDSEAILPLPRAIRPGWYPAGWKAQGYSPHGWYPGAVGAEEEVELAPDLPTAIWDALAADEGLEIAFGRPAGGEDGWLQWPDGEAGLPYAVMLAPVDLVPYETTFRGDRNQSVQVQIAIYADTKGAAQTLGARVLDAFADEDPDVIGIPALAWETGREVARFPKDPGFAELDPDPGPDGESEVWAYRVLIDLWIVRVRATVPA